MCFFAWWNGGKCRKNRVCRKCNVFVCFLGKVRDWALRPECTTYYIIYICICIYIYKDNTQARTNTICKYRCYINRFLYGVSQDKLDPHSEFSHPVTSPNLIKRPSPYTQARTNTICKYRCYINRFYMDCHRTNWTLTVNFPTRLRHRI